MPQAKAVRPTLGRIVLVRDPLVSTVPFPAVVNQVWSETEVSVMAFPANVPPLQLDSVPFTDDADAVAVEGYPQLAWYPRV